MAVVKATETGNEVSQPTLEFTSLNTYESTDVALRVMIKRDNCATALREHHILQGGPAANQQKNR